MKELRRLGHAVFTHWRAAAIVVGACVLLGWGPPAPVPAATGDPITKVQLNDFGPQERVVIIGSSVADGWKDDKGGYLKRAFRALSLMDHIHYQIINHAIPGLGAGRLNAYVPGWIDSADAQITVISWGGLDDAYDHTPMDLFRDYIRQEIEAGLAAHTVVLIITPPVSKATYTEFRIAQPEYLDAEMEVARSFDSPDVQVFDVFDAMRQYLVHHDQTYVPYMADGWHPNARGHKLAGKLLLREMLKRFGVQPIFLFVSHSEPFEARGVKAGDPDTKPDGDAGKRVR